jgi:hypothetical protein
MTLCPPALLRQYTKDNLVEFRGDDEVPKSELQELFTDRLDQATASQLIALYKLNNMSQYFTPNASWTEAHLRAAIRQYFTLDELIWEATVAPPAPEPEPEPEPPVAPPAELVAPAIDALQNAADILKQLQS